MGNDISLAAQQCALIGALLSLCPTPPAAAADLMIAENGQCEYQIVTPDKSSDAVIEQCPHQTGRLVQHAFKESGFDLPIVKEGERDGAKPSIYLGATAFARDHGCDPAELRGWSYFHKVVSRDVILVGRDGVPPDLSHLANWGRYFYYRLGTLKATADFLRVYAKTYFLYPGSPEMPAQGARQVRDWVFDDASIEFTKMSSISIPADLNLRKDAFTRYHKKRRAYLHGIANNFFPRVDEEAWVFVNGEPVGEHSRKSTGKSINQLWEEPSEIVVPPPRVAYGKTNTLVVSVNNTKAGGGIWRPVLVHRE